MSLQKLISALDNVAQRVPSWFKVYMEKEQSPPLDVVVWDGQRAYRIESVQDDMIGGLNCHTMPKTAKLIIVPL